MCCVDCFNNCPEVHPDKCVIYTGEEIPALGICTGDPISKVEKAVIEKLVSVLSGTGITLSSVNLDNCLDLKNQFVGKDKTLANLFQLLIDNHCTLKELISDLQETPSSFDVKCLSGVGSGSSSDQILQAAINLLCSVKSTVDAIPNTYVKISDINSYIAQYITNSGNTVTNYYRNLPAYVALPYFGDLSVFDNAGVGLESKGFKNIYICNGTNGTPDMRGRTVVGAIRNIPGGSLDAAVDPTLSTNPGTDYSVKDKFGENFVTLQTSQIPSHSHTVVDPGHSHTYSSYNMEGRPCGSKCDREDQKTTKSTGVSYTGITLESTGGGEAHNNRQPSIAACWIMAIY